MIDSKTQEVLRNRFNPDGSVLRQMQLRMLEMLRYIDRICTENSIPYWLSSGTCLGAVRHGGFIPWDDDCDIEMLGSDYERFVKIVMADTSSPYRMQTRDTDPGYFLTFGKLRDTHSVINENSWDRNYRLKGLYIDVFPMEKSNSVRLFNLISKLFFNLHIHDYTDRPMAKIRNAVLRNIILKPLSLINKAGASPKRLRHRNPGGFPWHRDRDDIFPLKHIRFESLDLPVPGNYDNYLSKIYGNYMSLPDLNKIPVHIADVSFK